MQLCEKTLLLAAKHGSSNSGFLVGSFLSEPGELQKSERNLHIIILFCMNVQKYSPHFMIF